MEIEESHLIKEEDFREWSQHPISQAYFRAINLKMKEIAISLGEGRTVNLDNSQETLQHTVKMVGAYTALQDILDIDLAKE